MANLEVSIFRGGTSRGVFLREDGIERFEPEQLESIFVSMLGSPDPRQVDGLGGAIPSSSKVVIVGRGSLPNEASYRFAQVMLREPKTDTSTICGNLSAAAAAFACDERLVECARGDSVPVDVTLYCPAVRRRLFVQVPVAQDGPMYEGDYRIPGINRPGAKYVVDWREFAGSVTGRMLPTGSARDVATVPHFGKVAYSVVDVGNVALYLCAEDLGIDIAQSPDVLDSSVELKRQLEDVRGHIGRSIGLPEWDRVKEPINPVLILVASPRDRTNWLNGEVVRREDCDFICTEYLWRFHKILSGSIIGTTAVAAVIPGTIPNSLSNRPSTTRPRIGLPAGVAETMAQLGANGEVVHARMFRTVRKLLHGTARVVVPSRVAAA